MSLITHIWTQKETEQIEASLAQQPPIMHLRAVVQKNPLPKGSGILWEFLCVGRCEEDVEVVEVEAEKNAT